MAIHCRRRSRHSIGPQRSGERRVSRFVVERQLGANCTGKRSFSLRPIADVQRTQPNGRFWRATAAQDIHNDGGIQPENGLCSRSAGRGLLTQVGLGTTVIGNQFLHLFGCSANLQRPHRRRLLAATIGMRLGPLSAADSAVWLAAPRTLTETRTLREGQTLTYKG
jgi:hypothetical protein